MLYNRILALPTLLKKKSFFLLGPRATGKSSLIHDQLKNTALIINLLESSLYLRLISSPGDLESFIEASDKKIAVIDEVQRIPMLLNEVHRLIESKKITFLLTGSSARKLKGKDINLLAGRAWKADLFPLVTAEISDFDLNRYLIYGGLPAVYNSNDPLEELFAYVETYLKEEIQAEALVRKIPAFSRFLQVSALTNGQMINFTNIAKDTGIPASTVKQYYQILEDTLIGFFLDAWTKSIKRKAVTMSKFYYFDTGVCNTIAGIKHLDVNSDLYGRAFEHFIILELRAYLSYRRIRQKLTYWRSKHGHEVDVLIGDDIAIEIKSSNKISEKHLKGLISLKEENIFNKYILVCNDHAERKVKDVEILHWKVFLKKLWSDRVVTI